MKGKFIIVLLLSVLVSCSTNDMFVSNYELLTTDTWYVNNLTVSAKQLTKPNGPIPTINYFDECINSSGIKFLSSGRFELVSDTEKCSGYNNIDIDGTWAFTNNEKQIKLCSDSFSDSTVFIDIINLDQDNFEVEYNGKFELNTISINTDAKVNVVLSHGVSKR